MRDILDKQKLKNKKAVSMMIGYVLLVSFAVIMGVIVFNWLKTYVPTDTVECPSGVSVSIRAVECAESVQEGNYSLMLNLSNNGLFEIDGFYIRATTSSTQQLATQDLSQLIYKGGDAPGNFVQFFSVFAPSDRASLQFFPLENKIYSIEVTPMKFEEVEGKIRVASCSDSKVKEIIECQDA